MTSMQRQLANLTNHILRTEATRGRQAGITDEADYTKRHQHRLNKQRVESCSASLAWLQKDGFVPLKVEIKNIRTGVVETISLNSEEVFGQNTDMISGKESDMLNMMLFIKDRFSVSGKAYHQMAKVCKEMPRHYKLKERIQELNKLWNIFPTPNGTFGMQQALEERLLLRVRNLHKTASPDAPFRTTRNIRVKISGDGTNIDKHLHVINVTFTIFDEALAYSGEGNHILAIVKKPENYECLFKALEDIRKDVKRVTTVVIESTIYNLMYYLGGDWKFLATITGIDSALAEYACIWCKCTKSDRVDMDKRWSLTDTDCGAWIIEENVKLSKKKQEKVQCIALSVISFYSIE